MGYRKGDEIPFPTWKGLDEYREPVDPTSLSANFADVFPEVASLINSHVEWAVILNYITQYNNKSLRDERNKTFKLHRLDRSMEKAASTF